MVSLVAGEEIEEQPGLVESPFAAAVAAPENRSEQLLGGGAIEKMLLVGGALIGVARRDGNAVDAERVTVSKNAATRAGSASLKNVQLIVTRKPFAFASFSAATARSYTPGWHTDLSCISRSPSR